VLERKKTKICEGAGLGDYLACYADEIISDQDFLQEKETMDKWNIATKEELLYYRIYCEHFGRPEEHILVRNKKSANFRDCQFWKAALNV
jgi:hypothetical protein